MPLRLLQVRIPAPRRDELIQTLDDLESHPIVDRWHGPLADDDVEVTILVSAEHSEAILDEMSERFTGVEGFRAVIVSVEAAVPRPEEEETDGEDESAPDRVSRPELLDDVHEMSHMSLSYVVLMALATIVAVIGLLLDNVAVIIGSMVIAPLIGPSVGLALSATLADRSLAVEASKALGVGLAIGGVMAAALGVVLPVDPSLRQLAIRSRVTLWDVGLGLAVGGAGALSVTTGVSAALVGVMVAVALLPPLAAFGLFLGSGHLALATAALLLLTVYLICINLAGVTTFAAQGIQPRTRWEAEKAHRASRWVLVLWSLLLVGLVAIMWWVGLVG